MGARVSEALIITGPHASTIMGASRTNGVSQRSARLP